MSKGFSGRLEKASDRGPGGVMDARMRRLVESEVIICLVGPIAQRVATGDEAAAEAGGGVVALDEKLSRALSEKFGEDVSSMLSPGSDYQQASEVLLKATAGDDEEAAAWEGWLRIRAERLVSSYWKQITSVAGALRVQKALSGSEVRQIL